jgi:kanamycin kinase
MHRLAGDMEPVPVWRNADGVLTCALYAPGAPWPIRYLKWVSPGTRARLHEGSRFDEEAQRLRWAAPFTPVPRVVDVSTGTDAGDWLMTEAVLAQSAVSPTWRSQPSKAVQAIGEGLRAFHDSLPVQECPFSWSVPSRLAGAQAKYNSGYDYPPSGFKQDRHGLTPAEALRRLHDAPAVDQLVVCHGDPCCPNTLVNEEGKWCAHVDLDHLGVADRWADIAVAAWSCEWNYGPQWGAALLDAYGIQPDEERTWFYRLLWDMA